MTLFLPPLDELQKWPGRNVLAYAVYWGRALAARYKQIHRRQARAVGRL